MQNNFVIKEELLQEDINIIVGCLLTTQEFLNHTPFKNEELREKTKQIELTLKKFKGE